MKLHSAILPYQKLFFDSFQSIKFPRKWSENGLNVSDRFKTKRKSANNMYHPINRLTGTYVLIVAKSAYFNKQESFEWYKVLCIIY